MIRIHNVRTEIKENIDIENLICKKLHIKSSDIKGFKIHKRSIDARNKKLFSYVFDVDVTLEDEDKYLNKFITKVGDEEYHIPKMGDKKLEYRPLVIGAGPAGLFCAYELAKCGYKPIVIERGEKVEDRINTVNKLWNDGLFKENSNVQFGEGGAGTFSDGKLNTLVKDKNNRMKEVFKVFVECGANEDILYDYHPHIGTDILREVVKNLRNKIISYGGEFRYNSLMEHLVIKNNTLERVIVNGEEIKTNVVVLAIGHSARDTFLMLNDSNLNMESKSFAVGVRIMHPQKIINENQYPINYPFLDPASYKLTYKSKSGRGVYSFCMCPGGYVVNARSTNDGIVVNGMSDYKRDSGVANSAIVVTVSDVDYGTNLFDGMHFQEKIEQCAYNLTKGVLPAQKYIDYKNEVVSNDLKDLKIKGNYITADINKIFPLSINETLKEGIDYFGTKINGFNGSDAIVVAPETRTSSPIRIIRDENLESNILGIYPAGEGAGYAGGITTSAIDGIKVFEKIREKYHNFL